MQFKMPERKIDNLFSGAPLAIVLSFIYLLSKPVSFCTNIYYLAKVGLKNDPALNESFDPEENGAAVAASVTFVSLLYETIGLAGGALLCCIFVLPRTCNFVQTLAVQRAIDLLFVVIFVPLSHTNFFVLGEVRWYFLMAYRLFYFGLIFAATAITGIGLDKTATTVTSWGHLGRITWKIIQICLKLLACSSALATYLTIGIVQDPPVRDSYFAFTFHRGLTSLFTLGANSLLLRFAVQEDQTSENKWDRRIRHFLLKWEPHSHVAAWNDFVSYGGLIVLNIYILAGGDSHTSLIVTLITSIFGILLAAASYILGTKWCGRRSLVQVIFDRFKQTYDLNRESLLNRTVQYAKV